MPDTTLSRNETAPEKKPVESQAESSNGETGAKVSPWAAISNDILTARIQGSVESVNAKAAAPEAAKDDDTLRALKKEIAIHEIKDQSSSYLGKVFDYVYTKDQKSLEELKGLYKAYGQSLAEENPQEQARLQKDIQTKIADDMKKVGFKEELQQLGGNFTKMMFLFVQGNVGVAGTIGSYALDQARPADGWKTQLLDGSLGATKGLLMRQVVGVVGQSDMPLALKGVSMGVSNRFLDSTLTRQNYFDPANGNYSASKGLETAFLSTLNPKSMMLDGVIFGVATGLTAGVNGATNDAISRSPFLQTVTGAYIFGSTAGALSELNRSQANGEQVDISRILWESQKNGLLTGLAATVGGLQGDTVLRQQIKDKISPPAPAKELSVVDVSKIWESNPKSMVQKGYFEVAAEKVDAAKHPQGKLFSSTEHPMTLQNDVTVPGQKGADGKPLVLKAGSELPNGVQFSPQELTVTGKTADGQPIRSLSGVKLITPETGIKLADGSVLKSAQLDKVTVANGQEVKPNTSIITRQSVDLETGKPRIDTYSNSPEKFAKLWKEVPGKPGVYAPNLDGATPMEVVQVPSGTTFKFKASYDPNGPWVDAKPGDLIKRDVAADGTLKGFYRVSAQDALETHIASNAATAARLDSLTREIYQRSGAVVARAQAPKGVLTPFLQEALKQARSASANDASKTTGL